MHLTNCTICPRECNADRAAGRFGYCRAGDGYEIASICTHHGEEPVFGGECGICNIFFARCNLQCIYCQNYQISRNDLPRGEYDMSFEEVVAKIEPILATGVRHVGFVSPSHMIPQMRKLLRYLSQRDPRPIFVMNTNGYDKAETIKTFEGEVDVYLPDLKYVDEGLAESYSGARDYPKVAARALREMFRQKGSRLELSPEGHVLSGLIIRHLVLPGHVENSKRCLRFIAEELSPSVHLSLLAQYSPTVYVSAHPELGRQLSAHEYEEVLEEMDRLGFHNGWTQALPSARHYNPDFKQPHPFE